MNVKELIKRECFIRSCNYFIGAICIIVNGLALGALFINDSVNIFALLNIIFPIIFVYSNTKFLFKDFYEDNYFLKEFLSYSYLFCYLFSFSIFYIYLYVNSWITILVYVILMILVLFSYERIYIKHWKTYLVKLIEKIEKEKNVEFSNK